jgi:hypothetical protein
MNFTVLRNNQTLVIVGVLVFFLVIMPMIEERNRKDAEKFTNKIDSNKLGIDDNRKIDMKECSRDCCKHVQWKVPHMPESTKDNVVGSNLMCNHGVGGGCVCVEKQDLDYLSVRGGNIVDDKSE